MWAARTRLTLDPEPLRLLAARVVTVRPSVRQARLHRPGGVPGGLGLHLQQGGGHYSQHQLLFYLILVLIILSHPKAHKELVFMVGTKNTTEGGIEY